MMKERYQRGNQEPKSKKDRQFNGQKIKDGQFNGQKIKDR
jgi:hypothetical protein